MKRFFITSLIFGLFTFALIGCSSAENNSTTGGNQNTADQVKEMDSLIDSVRTDQYADKSLEAL
ncbi:hypothetical protein IT413_05605 [Candidatus Peregrinibacteria bacterium]|nr:hypothetical protein [Candidatus Peregrinibacteria bacterium]